MVAAKTQRKDQIQCLPINQVCIPWSHLTNSTRNYIFSPGPGASRKKTDQHSSNKRYVASSVQPASAASVERSSRWVGEIENTDFEIPKRSGSAFLPTSWSAHANVAAGKITKNSNSMCSSNAALASEAADQDLPDDMPCSSMCRPPASCGTMVEFLEFQVTSTCAKITQKSSPDTSILEAAIQNSTSMFNQNTCDDDRDPWVEDLPNTCVNEVSPQEKCTKWQLPQDIETLSLEPTRLSSGSLPDPTSPQESLSRSAERKQNTFVPASYDHNSEGRSGTQKVPAWMEAGSVNHTSYADATRMKSHIQNPDSSRSSLEFPTGHVEAENITDWAFFLENRSRIQATDTDTAGTLFDLRVREMCTHGVVSPVAIGFVGHGPFWTVGAPLRTQENSGPTERKCTSGSMTDTVVRSRSSDNEASSIITSIIDGCCEVVTDTMSIVNDTAPPEHELTTVVMETEEQRVHWRDFLSEAVSKECASALFSSYDIDSDPPQYARPPLSCMNPETPHQGVAHKLPLDELIQGGVPGATTKVVQHCSPRSGQRVIAPRGAGWSPVSPRQRHEPIRSVPNGSTASASSQASVWTQAGGDGQVFPRTASSAPIFSTAQTCTINDDGGKNALTVCTAMPAG